MKKIAAPKTLCACLPLITRYNNEVNNGTISYTDYSSQGASIW